MNRQAYVIAKSKELQPTEQRRHICSTFAFAQPHKIFRKNNTYFNKYSIKTKCSLKQVILLTVLQKL